MPFKFNCPKCGQHIEAEPSMVGEVVSCPGCGDEIAVTEPPEPKVHVGGKIE